MSQSSLIFSYIMGIYFIAMNRHSGLSAEENYTVIETAMKNSKLFKKIMRTAEDYLDDKKTPQRLKWSEESHKLRNENNWVVDVLPKCAEYDLGYDYHECGICKICRDEGCFELANYLCRLDFTILVFSTYRHYKRTDEPNDRYRKQYFIVKIAPCRYGLVFTLKNFPLKSSAQIFRSYSFLLYYFAFVIKKIYSIVTQNSNINQSIEC